MPSDQEKWSFHLEKPDTPSNKKHVVENDSVLRLVAWGGAFAFACSLVLASTFKRIKKNVSPKRSGEGESDLDVGGFGESTTQDADAIARQMEGLRLLLHSSSSDINSLSCHTTSEMLVKYTSIEVSEDENRPLTTEPILKKKEEENIVVIIYEEEEEEEEEEEYTDLQKYDESSKVVESCSSTGFDETWLADWKYKPSTSSSSSLSEETSSSSGNILQEIDYGDDKNINIVIYIDDDDDNGEDEHAHIV